MHVCTWVVSDCLTRGWEVQLLPPVAVASSADRLGQSIYQDGRAIVPNGSGRRARGGVLGFSADSLAGWGGFRR